MSQPYVFGALVEALENLGLRETAQTVRRSAPAPEVRVIEVKVLPDGRTELTVRMVVARRKY